VIDIEQALEIRKALPPFVTVTALFLNESADWVAQVVHRVRPDCMQFHGDESPEFCESWLTPYIKSIPMGSIDNPDDYAQAYTSAQGFLFDSNVAGRLGGSGDTFDWSKIPSSFDYPLVLAGGINSSNVAEAIARVQPWAVDVSSGVEVSRGVKSTDLMDQFFQEVERGDETKVRNKSAQ
jgi:phosphoribosylanthranilate isomerase